MSDQEVISRLLYPEEFGIDQYSDEDLSVFAQYLGIRQTEQTREILLRLTAHFTPQQALAKLQNESVEAEPYDSDKEPYQMIYSYVLNNFSLSENAARELSYKLGHIWKNWQVERGFATLGISKTKLKERLSKQQNNRCMNCGARFERSENSIPFEKGDIYKPVSEFTDLQYEKELDHAEPISKLGANEVNNFQLLCRFCNQGKSDDSGFSLEDRLEFASKDIKNIPASKRRALFFESTASKTECQSCGDSIKSREMTIRKKYQNGCFAGSNIEMLCVDCVYN